LDEFSLITNYFASADTASDVALGIGDDAAVINLPQGEQLLVSTDTLISGVHFPENTSPEAIAHKALTVNISDIAAMGAKPRWFTLALSIPEVDETWLSAFSGKLTHAAEHYGVNLVGGDTTKGTLSITITVMGTAPTGNIVSRAGAMTGDLIYTTGSPGLASLGLLYLQGNAAPSQEQKLRCIECLEYPEARVREGEFLRTYATAMIDMSDGLAADLGHLLKASNVAAYLHEDLLTPLVTATGEVKRELAIKAVLHGGDDYELLFTLPAEHVDTLNSEWPADYASLTCIGEIVDGSGINLISIDGKLAALSAAGYNHFDE
jgi:thiamine-monophosphate kinase